MERYKNNPIIKRENIPEIKSYIKDPSSVFNPGATKYNDIIKLMLRIQNRARETFFVMANSEDGINFSVENKIVEFKGIEEVKEKIYHCYDARITRIDNFYYIMFAMDMEEGCKLGLAQTEDFEQFEFMGIVSENDVRNGVLFPEKINGKYMRLERPNKFQVEGGPKTGTQVFLSESDDLLHWNYIAPVFAGRFHYWDELIGSGPPPIKTRHGWLHIYHGIALHYQPIYQAGVILLDLNDPSKVIARGKCNILEPRELYETVGQVPNVIFPSGMIVKEYDSDNFAKDESEVYIYYGAADTSVGLAISSIKELIYLCYNY